MILFVVLIILSATMLHAVWNANLKTAADRTTLLGLVAFGHVLPASVMVMVLPLLNTESFIYILLSTVVYFGYYFMLAKLISTVI